jgi:type I restriction enzyme S subunit
MSWEKKPLGEIINLKRGYDLPSQKRKYGYVPIISSSGITDFHSEPAKTGEGVVTGRYGTLGQLFYINGDYWPLNTTLYVQDFKGNIPKFIYYFLKTLSLEKFNAASAVPGLDRNVLHKIDVNFISHLPTQRKIASILSAYDDLIENNLKRIKLLEGAININYKNFISIEDKNFINVKLNSFVNIISGFPFKSNYYNENGKHKIVTIKNVQDGFFVPVVTDRIDDVPDNMNNGLFLSTGDVIMSLTGNVGRVCLVYGDDYVLNQRVVKLSAKELIDQSFIYALVRDKQMLTILENLSNGTAQQNLSPIKMGELPIRYPSSNLREDFDKKVSPMIEMICKLNMQNTKLREARDILLPKLMNGQIEV